MKWFRVYSEIKDDPKMLEMDDHQRWLWICLMSLANDSEQRGTILNVRLRGLASSLRTTEDKLREALELYQELDMAEYDEDARTITLLNFIKRQYDKPSDAPEQTRERQRVSRQRHATVTPSHALYTDTDTETETDTESERSATFTPGPVVARASVTRTVGVKPNSKLSPAVNTFAQVTGKFPPRGIHHLIDAAFEARNDPDLLQRCYETWLARGYRPENIAWLQEWYVSGAIPDKSGNRTNGHSGHARSDTRDGYNVPAGYEDVVNTDARTVTAPDPWRDLLAEADTLAPMVRETPQVKERTLRQLTRKLDGILAALPLPYDAALATLGERLA